ncbi:pectinesterase family protein [Cellvibrio sp.]|uniref:pectinesterase family protein n=1 Tax=Cellvibrio sp. TaxID=1965322 RepID=UPI0039647BDA
MPLIIVLMTLLLSACNTSEHLTKSEADYDAVVGGDGHNAFPSLQAAIDAAPKDETVHYRILVKPGRYKEKVNILRSNVTIKGDKATNTLLYFDAYAGNSRHYRADKWGTPGSATLSINATDVSISDITIENTFDYLTNDAKQASKDPSAISESQAVAVLLDTASDRVSFNRVVLNGYQDTFFANGYRAYFRESTISGNVDFIFGKGTVVFEKSKIVTRPRNSPFSAGEIQSFVTAPSTDITSAHGLTFINCVLTREQGVPDRSITLGRPWHPTTTFPDGRYADPKAIGKTVFINTFMDRHINEDGWSSMPGTARDGTKTLIFTPDKSRFYEYKSTGPGAAVNAKRPQISKEEVANYSVAKILGDWHPQL